MFVGWIRQKSFLQDINLLKNEIFIDEHILLQTQKSYPNLCYAGYEDNKLCAIIGAFEFEKSILINSFYYTKNVTSEDKQRLIGLLLKNITSNEKDILFLAYNEEKAFFEHYGFKVVSSFAKATYTGGAHFNFTNATAQSINSNNFIPTIKKYDTLYFSEDKSDYLLHHCMKNSSLIFSTLYGYQHSYALDKSIIKISPFIVDKEVFSDAEKLLRGVIYHRGLKKIIAFFPSKVEEIKKMYEKYNFSLDTSYSLLSKGNSINIDLESVYGF